MNKKNNFDMKINNFNSKKGAYPFSKSEYSTVPFHQTRKFMIDSSRATRKMNMIHFHVEVDVTDARTLMKKYKKAYGESLSFTSFIIYCFIKTIDDNKLMHAYRKIRRKLIIFNDIDANVIVEKTVNDYKQPFYFTIRKANKKRFVEIQNEIRLAKSVDYKVLYPKFDELFFLLCPQFVRDLFFSFLRKFPKVNKVFRGTTAITSFGMHGKGVSFMIPLMPFTSTIAIGTIDTREIYENKKIKKSEILNIVFSFDHDIIDGVPAQKCIEHFKELVKGCYGLHDLNI